VYIYVQQLSEAFVVKGAEVELLETVTSVTAWRLPIPARLIQVVMHSFSILNSHKRAIIALIHTVIFFGVAALQSVVAVQGFFAPRR